MNTLARVGLTLTAIGLSCGPSAGQTYVWGCLTTADAIRCVREFEGNLSLAVAVTASPQSLLGPPGPDVSYRLSAGVYAYTVCAYTASLFQRSDSQFQADKAAFYGQPYDPSVLKSQSMSRAAAQSIAQATMLAHFPNPQMLDCTEEDDWRLGTSDFVDAYVFTFYGRSSGGVAGPSFCKVTVDSVRGRVVRYSAALFPVLIGTIPALTCQQAAACAASVLGISDAQLDGDPVPPLVSKPDALGVERLYYSLFVIGTDAVTQDTMRWRAYVDANDGSVIETAVVMSRPAKRANRGRLPRMAGGRQVQLKVQFLGRPTELHSPPVLVANRAYMHSRYLCSSAGGSQLKWKAPGRLTVSGPGRRVTFGVGSTACTVRGRHVRLPAPPVLVAGRCYVPIELVNNVLPYRVRFDAATRTVCIERRTRR
jgi:hypothetical protein